MRHTKTERGFPRIEFRDENGVACSAQDSSLAKDMPELLSVRLERRAVSPWERVVEEAE